MSSILAAFNSATEICFGVPCQYQRMFVDHRFLSMESNAYQNHFDIPFFKYLTPIHDDFKAAHRRKVSCRDQVLEAVIVDTASSLVTAEAVRFALPL